MTLGSSPAGLGVIEGVAIVLGAGARFGGGSVLHEPGRRRTANMGGYALLAACTSAMAATAAAVQVAALRAGAWIHQTP